MGIESQIDNLGEELTDQLKQLENQLKMLELKLFVMVRLMGRGHSPQRAARWVLDPGTWHTAELENELDAHPYVTPQAVDICLAAVTDGFKTT